MLFALLIMMSFSTCAGDLDSVPKIDPLNHDFQDYIECPENWTSQHYDKDGKLITLGIIPSPTSVYWPDDYVYSPDTELISESHQLITGVQLSGYPTDSYFSLVDEGRVTPVKDQGSTGTCWAFATLASLESYLIPVDSYQWDFSENNMKNLLSDSYSEGFDRAYNDAGNAYMSAAYLTRWSGPILDSDDPFNENSGVSPTDKDVQKHVQKVLILPPRNNSIDNRLIKKIVKEEGGVLASFNLIEVYFKSKGGYDYVTYYNPTIGTNSGHSICIVGWDDNFNKSEFATVPPGDGAFICKNSWGTNNGINGTGYFYISYYDANLGMEDGFKDLFFYTAESPNNYEKVYQYDPLGWTHNYRYDINSIWAANVFTAESNEELQAIGFYTPQPDVNYDVYVYINPVNIPNGGTLLCNSSGSFELPGYHTIPLEQSVSLSTGDNFSIVVKLSSGSTIVFPIEGVIENYSSKASANTGESYISSNGTSWSDLASGESKYNCCIKAYTTTSDNVDPVINSVSLNNSNPNAGDLILVSVNATDNVEVTSVEASGNILNYISGNTWEGTINALSGTHFVNVSARDEAGNVAWNNSTSYTVTEIIPDTQDPVINSVSLNDSNPNAGDLILVSVNATDNVEVTSVEADGSTLNYISGNTWEGTINALSGTHFVNVSARDEAGNVAWNNSTSYTVTEIIPDTEPPVIHSVSLNDSNPNAGDLILVSVNATDNVEVTSVEASGNILNYISGNTWEGTINALSRTHFVNVSARDEAGNVAWNNSTSYTVTEIIPDTQDPVINSVSLNNSNPNAGDLILVSVNATDNVEVTSVEASGNILNYISGNTWEGTINALSGTHFVNVSARDEAGNVAWNNSTSYTVTEIIPDTQDPVINSVSLNNSNPNAGDLILVSVNATDNVEVTSVEADGSTLNYISGNTWEGTINALSGTHFVNVSARDEAGNVAWNNSTSYTVTEIIPDTEPPVIHSVSLNDSNPNAGDLILVSVNATDNVEVTSVEASGNILNYISGNTWEGTINALSGTHFVNVSARDEAGNVAWNNSTSYTVTEIIPDTEPPVIHSVSLNDSNPNAGDLILVSVNATDNVEVTSVEADGSTLNYISGNTWEGTINALSGTHFVNVSARDEAGNVAWNNSTSYTVTEIIPDTQDPVINSVSLNNSNPNAGDFILVSVNATDNVEVTSVEASGNILNYISGNTWEGTINALSRTHFVNVSARDEAGNVAWNNSTSYTVTEIIPDTQDPVINSVSLNNSNPNAGDLILVSVNATDNVEVTSVEASGNILNYISGNIWEGTINALSGTHFVNVSARDEAGNVAWNNSTSYTVTEIIQDTEPPVIHSFSSYPVNTTEDSVINVTVNVTDNIGVVNVTVDDVQLTKNGDLWEGSIQAPSDAGEYSIPVVALDAAGNKAESSLPCNVLIREGSVSFSMNPIMTFAAKGTTVPFEITILNGQNVDDTLKIQIDNDTVPTSSSIDPSWYSWTEKDVNLRAGEEITLLLEVEVPENATGFRFFVVSMDSTLYPTNRAGFGCLLIN
ncbi:lectin like domain-containing protein [Methanosarcina siciliae]|nr:lectin like domain-containing protein [Methanosarcina siciliae]